MRTFSVFCKRSYLCDVLITSSDALGRKMLDLSHSLSIVMSYKYFEFFPALCVTLIMMVSADCSQNNSDPSWAGQRLHAFQRFLDCTAHYNPTSNAGTSINYVQSSFYIQACSWIYIRNY